MSGEVFKIRFAPLLNEISAEEMSIFTNIILSFLSDPLHYDLQLNLVPFSEKNK